MTLYDLYIKEVSSSKILTCEKIKLAVLRHLNDLEKAESKDYPYYFDEKQAKRYIDFISCFRLTDQDIDKETGLKPLVPLQGFQGFFIASIAGWRRKDNKEVRRYTDVYFQVARKNAKSTLIAMMMTAHFFLDKKNLGQFFTAATSRAQAAEVFNMIKEIIVELRKEYPEIKDRTMLFRDRIVDLQTKSFIEKVSKEAKSLEGKGSYCSSLDEYHLHNTDEIVSSLRKGGIKHDSPIIYRLTTPGFNIGGPCHQHYEYCGKILTETVQNDNIFAMIFELDKDDDWHNTDLWIKPNPNLGLSPKLDAVKIEYTESVAKGGSAMVDFKTKILSMWVSSGSEWIPDAKYMESCTDWNIMDFVGSEVFCGLDMAYSDVGDLCSFSMFIPDGENSGKMFVKYWIPEIKANDSGTGNIAEIDYLKCEEDGWVTVTEGDMTKYDDILSELLDFNDKFTIRNIYFDAWNISYFYEQMEKNGLPVFKYNQSISNLSPPTKRIAEMIHTKDIDFGMNPITRWMFSNVELQEKGPGLVKLTRTNKKKKIDGVISSVMAMGAYTNYRLQNKPFNPQIIVL